jgi:hypothetical protein
MPVGAAQMMNDTAAFAEKAQDRREHNTQDKITNPRVYAAAQSIINYHHDTKRNGGTFRIEAFDVPHDALVDVAEQLDALGATHAVKITLLDALKDYVMSKGGSFARSSNAKPIYIALEVGGKKPEYRFEDGQVEMAAIDGMSAIVEGASMINVRLTTSGTAMTTNQADVDRMFAHVKGDKLWIQFEAPSKEELDGLMSEQQVALAAIGETIGGAVSAEELKTILEDMQNDGLVTPEIIALLENMIEMRVLAEAGVTAETEPRLRELMDIIAEQLKTGVAEGSIPVTLGQGVIESLSSLAETQGLVQIVTPELMADIAQAIDVAALVEKLESVIETLDPETEADSIAALEETIEAVQNLEGQDLAEALVEVGDTVAMIDMPETVAAEIAEIVAVAEALSAEIIAHLPEPDAMTSAMELAAAEIVEVLQQLDDLDDLPLELASLIEDLTAEGIDIESLTPEALADILTSADSAPVIEAVQNIVLALNNPDVQMALPQETLNSVNQLMNQHDGLIEMVAVAEIVQNLQSVVEQGDLSPAQAEVIQDIIERVEAGEDISSIAPEELAAVQSIIEAADVSSLVTQALTQTLAVIENHQAAPVVLAQESLVKIEAMDTDLAVIVAALETGDALTPEQATLVEKIENVREALQADPANIEALQELSTLATLLQSPEIVALLPDTIAPMVEALAPQAQEIASVQEVALAIKHQITPAQIQNTVEIITALETLKESPQFAEFAETDISTEIAQIIEALSSDPVSMDAAVEIVKLETIINDPSSMPAEVRDVLIQDIGAQIESITVAQIEVMAQQAGVMPEIMQQNIQIVAAIESQPAVQQMMLEAGVDMAVMTMELSKPEGLAEMAKLAEVIKSSPEMAQSLPPEVIAHVQTVMDASVKAIAADIVQSSPHVPLDVAVIEQTVVEMAVMAAAVEGTPEVKQALQDAGVTSERIEQIMADLKDPASPAALAAMDEIAQVSPAAVEILADKGIDMPQVAAAQTVIVAAALDVSPAQIQNVRDVQVMLQDPEIRSAIEQAGIDLPDVISIAEGASIAPEIAQQILTIQQQDMPEIPVAVAEKIALVEDKIIRDVAATLDMEPAEIKMLVQTTEGRETVMRAVEAAQVVTATSSAAVPEAIVSVAPDVVAAAVIKEGIAPERLSDAQQIKVEAVIEKIETGEALSAQDIETLSTVRDSLSGEARAQIEQTVTNIITQNEAAALVTVDNVASNDSNVARLDTAPETVKPEVLIAQLDAIVAHLQPVKADGVPVPAAEKVTLKALELAIKGLENAGADAIPVAQAEAILMSIDTASKGVSAGDVVLMQQMKDIRAQVVSNVEGGPEQLQEQSRTGPCKGCGGGSCADCKTGFAAAIGLPSAAETVHKVENLGTFSFANQNNNAPSASVAPAAATAVEPASPPNTMITQAPKVLDQIVLNMKAEATMVQNPVENKIPLEAVMAASRMLHSESQNTLITPEKAEVIIRKLDEGAQGVKSPQIAAEIEKIRENVINRTEGGPEQLPAEILEGPCPGCAGGSCADCGVNFLKASSDGYVPPVQETVNKVEGLADYKIGNNNDTPPTHVPIAVDPVVETPKPKQPDEPKRAKAAAGPCGDCISDCSVCSIFKASSDGAGGAPVETAHVDIPSVEATVSKVTGLSSFRLDKAA